MMGKADHSTVFFKVSNLNRRLTERNLPKLNFILVFALAVVSDVCLCTVCYRKTFKLLHL